jgi:internalin A
MASGETPPAPEKKRIFVSYGHKDRKWMQELEVTLRPMLRDGEFMLWNDSQIEAGDRWRGQIEAELKSASVAILLVSRYFFASDFIAKNELPPLLERAARDGVGSCGLP